MEAFCFLGLPCRKTSPSSCCGSEADDEEPLRFTAPSRRQAWQSLAEPGSLACRQLSVIRFAAQAKLWVTALEALLSALRCSPPALSGRFGRLRQATSRQTSRTSEKHRPLRWLWTQRNPRKHAPKGVFAQLGVPRRG